MFYYPDEAMRFLDGVSISLGWFEDAFPPGEPRWSPNSGGGSPLPSPWAMNRVVPTTPNHSSRANAVEVVRFDVTCMGSISGMGAVIEPARAAGRCDNESIPVSMVIGDAERMDSFGPGGTLHSLWWLRGRRGGR